MKLSNVIWKLGFRGAFDETVNGTTENSKCIEFTMYLLSFFMGKNLFFKLRLKNTIPSYE